MPNMKARMQVEKPDEIMMTLTVTMPVEGWRRLSEQLKDSSYSTSWPSWEFRARLAEIVQAANQHFVSTTPAGEPE